MTETGGSGPEVTAHVAGHLTDHPGGEREQALLSICAQAVTGTVGLHHLAYYTDRVLDFALDVLDEQRTARPGLRRLGRQLCGEFELLDDRLRYAHTGALVRTVLRTDDVEVVCDPVVRAQYVVGVTYTDEHDYIDESNQVDRSLAGLVADLRSQVGLASRNVGGYETDTLATPSTDDRRIEPHVDQRGGELPASIEQACLAALNPHGLHLVGCLVDDEVVFLGDILEHSALALYYGGPVTPAYRREFYRELSGQLAEIRTRLARVSAQMLRGQLKRVVLDVEQGAVYYFRVDSRLHLVGVTLHQPRVRQVDLRLAELAVECGKLHPTE